MDLSWGSAAGLGLFFAGFGVFFWGFHYFIATVTAVSSKKEE